VSSSKLSERGKIGAGGKKEGQQVLSQKAYPRKKKSIRETNPPKKKREVFWFWGVGRGKETGKGLLAPVNNPTDKTGKGRGEQNQEIFDVRSPQFLQPLGSGRWRRVN